MNPLDKFNMNEHPELQRDAYETLCQYHECNKPATEVWQGTSDEIRLCGTHLDWVEQGLSQAETEINRLIERDETK